MPKENNINLCLQCGVCCDGSFFELAKIEPSDINPATSQLDMVRSKDKVQIKLPCRAHINNRCTIYEHRPGVCRAYECKLLIETKQGKVSVDSANTSINQLKVALAELDDLLTNSGVPKDEKGIHARVDILERKSLAEMPLVEYRKKYGLLLVKYRLLQELLSGKFGISFQKKG